MPRFFVKKDDVHLDSAVITGEDVNHIRKVLRFRCGDTLTLCDGKGMDYFVRIEEFLPAAIRTKIISSKENDTEPPINISLFQGIPKSDKMDFIIQKGIELGVQRIIPVFTERTVVRFDSTRDAEGKVSRWQRIALEAAKQSNRGRVPGVEMPVDFARALKLVQGSGLSIIPYEKESRDSLKRHIKGNGFKDVAVFIGPEGGFSEEEINQAVISGIKPVTLGPRILRTETAGIAVLSILMYELGDAG